MLRNDEYIRFSVDSLKTGMYFIRIRSTVMERHLLLFDPQEGQDQHVDCCSRKLTCKDDCVKNFC